jgi:PAS domain S-box-containing protein
VGGRARAGVLQALPEGVIVVDDRGRIRRANGAVERLFGYGRDRMLGQPVEMLVPEHLREGHVAHRRRFFADPVTRSMAGGIEVTGQRADGSLFPLEVSLSHVRTPGGALAVGLLTDITRRKEAENRLRLEFAVTRALADSTTPRAAARRVLEAIGENLGWDVGELWALDEAGGLLRRRASWHKAGLDVAAFEAASEEAAFGPGIGLPGRAWQSEQPVWVADVTEEPWYVRGAAAQASGLHAGVAFPVQSDRGFVGVLVFHSYSIRQPDEGLLRLMADIGSRIGYYLELGRAREELARQTEALHQADKLASLGTLVAGVVHEMNNPLGIISTRIELMLAEAAHQGLPRSMVEDLEVIHRHTQRMSRVGQSLLSFARQSPRQTRPVDLNGIVEDTLLLARKSMADQGVQIATVVDRTLPPLLADGTALQQLLLNLLTNAREAMAGGGEIRIQTRRAPTRPDWVQLVVSDGGPGIPAEQLPRIFDPFYTTKATGTGLGLSVSYAIVKDHRGTVDVQSTPGQGTTFTLSFPLLPASAGGA